MVKIETNLSQKDLKQTIKKLQNFKKNLKLLQEKILDDMSKEALDTINTSLSASSFEFSEPVKSFSRSEDNIREVGIQGKQALYEEYGTGTMGELNSHPKKDSSLNPYNSGETIRVNADAETRASKEGIPVGGLYWTYKFGGQKIYTQGRPAGAHVYKASIQVKRKAKEIIKRRVGEELSKL